jgi:hypothetical protein
MLCFGRVPLIMMFNSVVTNYGFDDMLSTSPKVRDGLMIRKGLVMLLTQNNTTISYKMTLSLGLMNPQGLIEAYMSMQCVIKLIYVAGHVV